MELFSLLTTDCGRPQKRALKSAGKTGSVEGDKKHENLDKKLQNPRQIFYQPLTFRIGLGIFAGDAFEFFDS